MSVSEIRDARWRRRLACQMAACACPPFQREFRGTKLSEEDLDKLRALLERFIDEVTS